MIFGSNSVHFLLLIFVLCSLFSIDVMCRKKLFNELLSATGTVYIAKFSRPSHVAGGLEFNFCGVPLISDEGSTSKTPIAFSYSMSGFVAVT